ncbi:MAG: LysR family transcriptional regulator [Pseudobdellovibrionaceae bacterium]
MDLNEVSAFLSIVQAGGMTRAAAQTGLPKSTLSRKLQQLEERLGVTLLQRTTRKITLTRMGEEYFRNCLRLFSELKEVESKVILEQQEPQGILRFTAPVESASLMLPPLIRRFCDLYPKVALEMNYTDRIVDLIGEGFDVALRAGEHKDSSLRAKKIISRERFILVGSPQYFQKFGQVKHPKDLLRQRLIGFTSRRDSLSWILQGPQGKLEIPLEQCFRTNSLSNCRGLALEAVGLTLLPRFLVQNDIRIGTLLHLLPDYYQDRGGFSLVYPAQNFLPPKTRAFLDFFAEELKKFSW